MGLPRPGAPSDPWPPWTQERREDGDLPGGTQPLAHPHSRPASHLEKAPPDAQPLASQPPGLPLFPCAGLCPDPSQELWFSLDDQDPEDVVPGVDQLTPTPRPTYTHAHTLGQSGEPISSCVDQVTREAIIQDHCPRCDPLLRRSTQVPQEHRIPQGQKTEPSHWSPMSASLHPGGRPRAKKTEHLPPLTPSTCSLSGYHPHLLLALLRCRFSSLPASPGDAFPGIRETHLHCPKAA